ncbi:unnamed protein product [Moneuplotes crassus]|uniref:Uncharacterized protein n=1 Tax=Euplotes crassus TaxID=5936 RepID=A0AAD1UEQ3_EUPCR|nr:unnamed protein product [Moneuplotes crassus]
MNYSDILSESCLQSQKFQNKYKNILNDRKSFGDRIRQDHDKQSKMSQKSNFGKYMEKMNVKIKIDDLKKPKFLNTLRPGTTKIQTKKALNKTQKRINTSAVKSNRVDVRVNRCNYWKSAKPRDLYHLQEINRKVIYPEYKVKEKAKRMNFSNVDPKEKYLLLQRNKNQRRRFNETTLQKTRGKKRAFSILGVENIKSLRHNQDLLSVKSSIARRSVTPTSRKSVIISSHVRKKQLELPEYRRKCESTIGGSVCASKRPSRINSPQKRRLTCMISNPRKSIGDLKRKIPEDLRKKEQTLKTVEERIREKFSNGTSQEQHSLKRFKQLQEYLKMAKRKVRINTNIRNKSGRIVKGEIPLGTDTQIDNELRENYPSILEIKRRLKNTLMIKCDFDEVIKYAQEYLGVNDEDLSSKHKALQDHKKKKERETRKKEDSIKLYRKSSPRNKKELLIKELRSDLGLNKSEDSLPKSPEKINNSPRSSKSSSEKSVNQDEEEFKFTRKKWTNIDELILALQEEVHTKDNQ